MPYRIAGIDVHKKMLAVVVADVEVDGDFHFERQKVGTTPADLRAPGRLAGRARGRGSRHGVDRAVLAAGVGGAGAALAAPAPGARRRAAARGHAPSRPSAIESRTRRPQEGLPGCGAVGETPGRAGADLELRARRRAAALAHRDAPQVPDHPQPRAAPQPTGGAARGSAHQGVQPRVGPARHQRPPHAAGAGGRRNRSGRPRGTRGPAPARHARRSCAMPSRRVRRCIRSTAGC